MTDTSEVRRVRVDKSGGIWRETANGCWSRSLGLGDARTISELNSAGISTTEAYLVPAGKWGRFDTLRRAKQGADRELATAREKIKALEGLAEHQIANLKLALEAERQRSDRYTDALSRLKSAVGERVGMPYYQGHLAPLLAALDKRLAAVAAAEDAQGRLDELRAAVADALGLGDASDEALVAALKGHLDALERSADGWRAISKLLVAQIQDLRHRLHEATQNAGDRAGTVTHLQAELKRWQERTEAAERKLAAFAFAIPQRVWVGAEPAPQKVSLDEETRDWIADLLAEVRRG